METASNRSRGSAALVALAVVAALLAVALVVTSMQDSGARDPAADLMAGVDAAAYQAVHLANGTTYYGKLSEHDGSLRLDDVYYLSAATEAEPSGSLVQRGSEIDSPVGGMILSPSTIVQIDNVGPTSVIARGIEKLAQGG